MYLGRTDILHRAHLVDCAVRAVARAACGRGAGVIADTNTTLSDARSVTQVTCAIGMRSRYHLPLPQSASAVLSVRVWSGVRGADARSSTISRVPSGGGAPGATAYKQDKGRLNEQRGLARCS